jgi:hypothetical protein
MFGPAPSDGHKPPDSVVALHDSLDRRFKSERDYVDGEIRVLETRLDGMDRATELLSVTVNRTPTIIQTEVAHLRERTDLQMDGVQQRFDDADKSVDAALAASREAIGAAFDSSRVAIAKAEASVEKRFDLITKDLDELKTNQSLSQGRGVGAAAMWGYVAAGIFLIIAVISFVNGQAIN